MKRRTFLKIVGCAASAPALCGIRILSAEKQPSISTIRVMSCNVRVDVPADATAGNGWSNRKELCADVILSRKPDLIGLQEVQDVHFDFFKTRFPAFDSYALYNTGKYTAPSNAIFYSREKFELKSAGGFWFSTSPHVTGASGWDSALPRLVNWVDLRERGKGRLLRFWNTHFDHVGQAARENSARMLVEASNPLPAGLPQVLTGDLNAGFDNKALQILTGGGWQDSYSAVHGPKDPGFTAHGFKGREAAARRPDGSRRTKIDWVLWRGPMKAVASEIIRDDRDGHYPSDHFFVSAEFEF